MATTEPLAAPVLERAPRRTALVTGASSGIGAAFAERFAGEGVNVILVARRKDRLEALATRIRRQAGVEATVIVADLTESGGLRDVEQAIGGCDTLGFLVNCAGVAGYMPFQNLPADRAEELILLHVIAPTRLTRAALPGMVARGGGAIINVSSGLAFSASVPAPPLPYRAVYAASKSYINTFSELLANELAGTGVIVQALCPGIVRTELHEVAGYDVSHVPFMLEPADVVSASLTSLRLGERVCVPSLNDASLLADLERARGLILEGARGSAIADRYREG